MQCTAKDVACLLGGRVSRGFQESCLALWMTYLFIILINDTFFLLDLLGTEWPGNKTDFISPLNSYWCLFLFTFYLHKWEAERNPCSLTEPHGNPPKQQWMLQTHLSPRTELVTLLSPRPAEAALAAAAQTQVWVFNAWSLWGGNLNTHLLLL